MGHFLLLSLSLLSSPAKQSQEPSALLVAGLQEWESGKERGR